MDTPACYSCGTFLSARALFCPECSRQVRCRACRALLEPNAKACVECGTSLGQGDAAATAAPNSNAVDGRALNRLRIEESRTTRSLQASFTDTAVESLSGPLSAFFMHGMGTVVPRGRRSPLPEISDVEEDVLEVEATASPPAAPKMLPAATDQPEAELLQRIFRQEGERLRLYDPRLKGKNKLDSARRLAYLRLLYASVIERREQVDRDEVVSIIKDADWLDSNTTSRILNNNNDITENGAQVGLSASGLDTARDMLTQVFNDSIKQTWKLGDTARKRSGKTVKAEGKNSDAEESTGKAKNERQRVSKWCEDWKSLGLTIDGNAAIRGKSPLEKAIFGLWAIRTATMDRVREVTAYSLADFLWRTFEIKVDRTYLARSLGQSDDTKDKVEKIGTKFHLKPQAMDYAKTLSGLG